MDPKPHIAALKSAKARLELDTADLCCLLLLQAAEAESPSLPEDETLDLLSRIHEQFPGSENPRKRATHGLQRLREQRLLVRVDASGISGRGDYALSSLGRAIVTFFAEDELLTRENLTILTATLQAQLLEVRDGARKAVRAEDWQRDVVTPLVVVARELLQGIERRTRGLDNHQQDVSRRIAEMLERDWFGAISESERLLGEFTETLRELRDVLLEEQKALEAVLDDIERLAFEAGAHDAETAARSSASDVARLAQWGRRRHETWSRYLQFMLETLRSIVRLDPDRALSHRLRDGLRGWDANPWHLVTVQGPRVAVLRNMTAPLCKPTVEQGHVAEQEPSEALTARIDLRALVETSLDEGATTLSEVLRLALPTLPEEQRYRGIGRVASILAERRRVSAELDPEWRTASPYEITDWTLMERAR
jgi:chromosome partition protein MukF